MTEITFHFNAPDRSAHACALLRDAARKGGSVVVSGARAVLERFDRELWSFDAEAFVAHAWLEREASVPQSLRASTVWLVDDLRTADRHETLLNLHDATPSGFESFERVIEVVSLDPADRAAARERWKHYAHRGYTIVRREVAA